MALVAWVALAPCRMAASAIFWPNWNQEVGSGREAPFLLQSVAKSTTERPAICPSMGLPPGALAVCNGFPWRAGPLLERAPGATIFRAVAHARRLTGTQKP
jgi:hypothetical protein